MPLAVLELYRFDGLRRTFAFHFASLQKERAEVPSVADLIVVFNQAHHVVHRIFHFLLRMALDGLHLAFEGLDDLSIADAFQFSLTASLVFFFEDVACESLEWFDDVPLVATIQLLVNIFQHPIPHFLSFVHRFDEAIYCAVDDFIVRQLDLQIGGKPELASHVAKDALEERVDGLDVEVRVVVEDGSKGFACLLAKTL